MNTTAHKYKDGERYYLAEHRAGRKLYLAEGPTKVDARHTCFELVRHSKIVQAIEARNAPAI